MSAPATDDPRGFASLSPRLLARKGAAKPAMRPNQATSPEFSGDDAGAELGWNDFGDEAGTETGEVLPFARPGEVPEEMARRSALARGGRAAFTLRLDQERHLRLRLACSGLNVSAQGLVTRALDRLLDDMPDIAAAAGSLGRHRSS